MAQRARLIGSLLSAFLLLGGCDVRQSSAPPLPVKQKEPVLSPDRSPLPKSITPDQPPPMTPDPLPPTKPTAPNRITDENFAELTRKHRPNELGRVLILEYHHVTENEDRWSRSHTNFRKDLELLYAKGYRAVNLLDYLTGNLNLPPGTSPVIFTFDDSSPSQFRWTDGRPDPKSAVGILLQFRDEHPDFGLAGTFYVNFNPVPFGDEAHWQEQIRFLVASGFEVANHTIHHEDLSTLGPGGVQRALAEQVRRLREVLPDYDGSTLALPFGAWPQNEALAVAGEHERVHYRHRAVLLVGADPVYSRYDRRFDPMALPRVQAIASEFERWLPFLDSHRYISDGDPETIVIPADLRDFLSLEASAGKKVRTYPTKA